MGAVDYVWGQCTWFVAHALPWLGVPIAGPLGNAGDWYKAKGFSKSNPPTIGSAVVYAPGGAYDPTYGHVAVVVGINNNGTFQVAEDNISSQPQGPFGRTRIRTSTMDGVEGFIAPPNDMLGIAGAKIAMQEAGGDPNQVKDNSFNPWQAAFNPLGGQAVSGATGAVSGAVDAAASDVGDKIKGLAFTILGFAARGALIGFGVVVILMGLYILFAVHADNEPMTSSTGTQEPTEEHTTVVEEQRGPRGASRGSTVTTTHRTRGKSSALRAAAAAE